MRPFVSDAVLHSLWIAFGNDIDSLGNDSAFDTATGNKTDKAPRSLMAISEPIGRGDEPQVSVTVASATP